MTSIDIREAVHEDADTIVGLLLELMDVMEHPVEIDQGQIRSNCEKLIDSDAAALFVAERRGIAVGFLSLAFRVTCLHAGPSALIDELVAGDRRFLVLSSPAEKGSYNYADDTALGELIKKGARGAYWDIISRNRG